MKTSVEIWTIGELYASLPTILEQPKYQRGAVWKPLKKQMLIDSILRGIDIPKIYLRKLEHGIYEFEVADGQQRITAIKDFIDSKIPLQSKTVNGLDLSKIGRYEVASKTIEEINTKLKDQFLAYELTVAIVHESSNDEIRTLFGRLQMGDTLNPAEKRNALISYIGSEIDNIVLHHNFFTNCKIPAERYKRQDYLSHAFALVLYQNKYDLKAPLFNQMYNKYNKEIPGAILSDTVKVLNWMCEIDKLSTKRIVNKWGFIDVFKFLYDNRKAKEIDYNGFANAFSSFEKTRALHSSEPEKLIVGKKQDINNINLYNYIISFKSNGGNPKNIDKRFTTFSSIFKNFVK